MISERIRYLSISGFILVMLALLIGAGTAQQMPDDKSKDIVDDVKPYEGSVGPGSALYGLKIALENLGERFTFNETQKIEKQVEHAELRLSEAKAEIKNNNIEAANRALEMYREKIQAADDRISGISRNEPQLLNAQERLVKHELVLQQLLESQPDNKGLQTALDNSQKLEGKVESKTRIKFEREVSNDRLRIRIREVREEEVQSEVEHGAEKEEIKAIVVGDKVNIRIKSKFTPTSADRDAQVKEILDKLKSKTRGELEKEVEIQVEKEKELQQEIQIEARKRNGGTEVQAEFRFPVDAIKRAELLQKIDQKLATLKPEDLHLNIKQEDKQAEQPQIQEERAVQAQIIGNEAEVRVMAQFKSASTDPNVIAQEILNKLKMKRLDIQNELEIQKENELEVEANDKPGVHEVKFDLRFQLPTKDKGQIIDGINQKLSALTEKEVRSAMDVKQEDRRGEGQGRHEAEAERGGAGEAERGGAGEAESGGGGGGSGGSGGGGGGGGGGG